jgi:NADH-quinone oxidoreductase subunit E
METETREWPQILLMEDEPTVAQGLQMVLKEEGYGVDLAMTGHSALDSFSRKGFDLLVADLRLPDIDGIEVIKKVKEERPETGVIVITGYSTVSSAVKAMKLGASDYLPKPFTEDEFKTAVLEALKEKQETLEQDDHETLEDAAKSLIESLMVEQPPEVEFPLSEIRKHFEGRPDELILMLQYVQNAVGFLPQKSLQDIARFTRLPASTVFGVATFYEQFRLYPAGKHIMKMCRGTACHVKGADRILHDLETHFHLFPGQTSDDRLFTLETVACFGCCALAPVVVIDESVHGRMSPSKIRQTLEALRE